MLLDKDRKPYKKGHHITNQKYANTLEIIQKDPTSFYTGKLAQMIARDMKVIKGEVTLDDLRKYKTVERKPLESELSNMSMYITPPPSSGAVLALILNILKGGCWLNIIFFFMYTVSSYTSRPAPFKSSVFSGPFQPAPALFFLGLGTLTKIKRRGYITTSNSSFTITVKIPAR